MFQYFKLGMGIILIICSGSFFIFSFLNTNCFNVIAVIPHYSSPGALAAAACNCAKIFKAAQISSLLKLQQFVNIALQHRCIAKKERFELEHKRWPEVHPGLLQNGRELSERFLIIINEMRKCYFYFCSAFFLLIDAFLILAVLNRI